MSGRALLVGNGVCAPVLPPMKSVGIIRHVQTRGSNLEMRLGVSALSLGCCGYLLHLPALDFLGLVTGAITLGMLLGSHQSLVRTDSPWSRRAAMRNPLPFEGVDRHSAQSKQPTMNQPKSANVEHGPTRDLHSRARRKRHWYR